MKEMRKILFVLSLFMLIVLTACGKKDVSENDSSIVNTKLEQSGKQDSDSMSGLFLDKNQKKENEKNLVDGCPDGVCEIPQVLDEEQCLDGAGLWDDRQEKCIDQTKQELIKEDSLMEKTCKQKQGTYIVGNDGEGKCVVVDSDGGKDCTGPVDCMSSLCQVEDDTNTQGKCMGEVYFSGCKKFLSSKGKVVTLCK